MWITLDQLDCLKAIQREGSITAAAEQLHRAKSAVYYSIKKLEEQLGFAVIDSEKYRGRLTEKGEQLLLSSEKLLLERDELKSSIHRIIAGVELKLSISASALFELRKFNRTISKLQKQFPLTEIIFHREILSGEKMLKRGITDIGLFERGSDNPEFETKKISEVKMSLVIAKKHEFLKLAKKQQTKDNLFHHPQVIQRSTIVDDEDLHGVYQKSRRWTVSDLASKRDIILDGLGWGRLPEHDIKEDIKKGNLIELRQIEKPFKIPMYLVRKKKEEHGKVSQALWESFNC